MLLSFTPTPLSFCYSQVSSPFSLCFSSSPFIFSAVFVFFILYSTSFMKWGMEILSPNSYLSTSSWITDESSCSTRWTVKENKLFENALALFDENMPDRWQRVAALLPGKTVGDVMRQYKELEDDVSSIEAGLIPVPGYNTTSSPYILAWGGGSGHGYYQPYSPLGGRKSSSNRSGDHERKKGVPWTEEEHKLFLMGLNKYGKGDWRNISRNFVVTRTPTQVASHAQKYFNRQLNSGKDRRRASIHDITTMSLEEDAKTPPANAKKSPEQQSPFIWNHNTDQLFGSHGEPNVFGSYWHHLEGDDAVQESLVAAQNVFLQMQSGLHYPIE